MIPMILSPENSRPRAGSQAVYTAREAIGMTGRTLALGVPCLASALAAAAFAQSAELKTPDGWVISPDDTKQPGEAGYRIQRERGPAGLELLCVPGSTPPPDGGGQQQ